MSVGMFCSSLLGWKERVYPRTLCCLRVTVRGKPQPVCGSARAPSTPVLQDGLQSDWPLVESLARRLAETLLLPHFLGGLSGKWRGNHAIHCDSGCGVDRKHDLPRTVRWSR